MQTLEVLCLCALNMLSFVMGAKIGQKLSKGEEIKLPDVTKLNPMTIYKEHQEKKEADKELEKLNTILENIERYDGTGEGQKDVPL